MIVLYRYVVFMTIWLSGLDENHGVIKIQDEGKGMNTNETAATDKAIAEIGDPIVFGEQLDGSAEKSDYLSY